MKIPSLETVPTTALAIRHNFLIFKMEFPCWATNEKWAFEIKFSDVPHHWYEDTGRCWDDSICFTDGVVTYGTDYEGGSWWAVLQFKL